jgi:hypothetical protein
LIKKIFHAQKNWSFSKNYIKIFIDKIKGVYFTLTVKEKKRFTFLILKISNLNHQQLIK